MRHLTLYGASDDLVEIVGDPDLDEIGTIPGQATFRLERPDGTGVRLHFVCEPSGCWSAGVSPLDDDIAVPPSWTFTVAPGNTGETLRAPMAYTTALYVTADDDAVLTLEDPAS